MKRPKSKWLFWLPALDDAVWSPFGWLIIFLVILWVPFLRVWWWVFLPLMLVGQLKEVYLWWLDWDVAYPKNKWVMLEVISPKEILVPVKAMEDFFSVVWPLYDTANFRDKWCDGELDNGPFWCSFELASIEGRVHFYIRTLDLGRTSVETALYSHYPDLEIKEVDDYVKMVPPTVPNDEWNMYGEDWDLKNPYAYPIRTYEKFFEPQGEKISAEEKRIDPIISLLELLSRLGPGEHYWVQFITVPVTDRDEPEWRPEGKKIINKLMKRPEKKEPTIIEDLGYVFKQVVLGPNQEGSGEGAKYTWDPIREEEGDDPPQLTAGEKEVLTEVENKLKKAVFRTTIRGVYVARRENWQPAHRVLMRSYMAHFNTNNLNSFSLSTLTRPKVNYFWSKRRVFLRARRMFRNAVLRFPPLFPDRHSISPILTTEEMATLYHFPLRVSGMVAPTMSNVDAKKAGPPPNLPTE